MFTSPNFNTHIANEILVTQLNELQNFFKPAIEVGGKISFIPLVATHRFPFSQNIHCNSLFSAILNQFIEAIREKQNFIRCNQCRKWTLKVKVRKEKRLYCCDVCRSKANRNRKSLDTYIALKVFKKYKNLGHYVKSSLDKFFGKKSKDPTSFFTKKTKTRTWLIFYMI